MGKELMASRVRSGRRPYRARRGGRLKMTAQKKRLESVGWKSSSVQEILGLDKADMEYIEMKLALSRRLRELRAKKNLTQTSLATALETSQSRVAKMEKGDPTVSIDLLLQALFRLGATRKELARAF